MDEPDIEQFDNEICAHKQQGLYTVLERINRNIPAFGARSVWDDGGQINHWHLLERHSDGRRTYMYVYSAQVA